MLKEQVMETGRLRQKFRIRDLFGGLSRTLLIAFILISILGIASVAIISVLLGTRIAQNSVFDELAAEVELNEQAINNWLDERRHDLAIIVNNPDNLTQAQHILSATEDKASAYEKLLNRFQVDIGAIGRFEEILLINGQGQIVVSTEADRQGQSVREQDYFQGGLLASYVSSPRFNPDLGANEIVATVPVRDEFSGVIGVLAGRFDLSQITDQILLRPNSTETGQIYLVSNDHRFLTNPRFATRSVRVHSVGIDQALTPGPNRNGQGIYEDYNGVSVVGAYRWIPDLEIALLSERTVAEAQTGVRQLVLLSGGAAILVLLIAVGVALFITARIVQPISILTEATVAMAEGDLTQRVAITTGNEIGILGQSFNRMTERLHNLVESLNERTRALETSVTISRQVTNILEVDQLLSEVVNSIQAAFGYYHVHIYLVDYNTGELIVREGTGEVGQQLKAKGHRLRFDQGIVGKVAQQGRAFLAEDVDQVPNFFRNPLLSETRAELAVPLRKGNAVLGVLDMQSQIIGDFNEEDLTLMQSIADQVAVAVENAGLFQQTQTALDRVEALNRRLTRDSWQNVIDQVGMLGYTFTESGATATETAWIPAMTEAIRQKNLAQPASNGQENGNDSVDNCLAVPLVLRDQVIGVIGVERPTAQTWSEDELVTIQTVTEQIALALDAARLNRQTERAAWRDQVVSESTARVWSSSEIEEVMKEAVAQLGNKLRASEVIIRLGSEDALVEEKVVEST